VGNDEDTAMQLAIGGNWQAIGQMERDLVTYAGLTPEQSLVDIGCGSGRLAAHLVDYLTGAYLGTDIVPELLDYARRTVGRDDWRFEHVNGPIVPTGDATADMVVFFSVFTHLLHEETYVYLREAKRVLKPGGTVVFSFLEFASPNHWPVFETMVATIGTPGHHNQFMSQDLIVQFAEHLGFEIVEIHSGPDRFIPLSAPARYDDGQVWEGTGSLGQSVCILRIP
jgi:SAM-dependent methyltransferase